MELSKKQKKERARNSRFSINKLFTNRVIKNKYFLTIRSVKIYLLKEKNYPNSPCGHSLKLIYKHVEKGNKRNNGKVTCLNLNFLSWNRMKIIVIMKEEYLQKKLKLKLKKIVNTLNIDLFNFII